jgi:CTP:phosphocholine cytidylyltransferase-like protein
MEDFLTVAIVLSGGSATRFGQLGQLMPKALLPVSSQQTLLSRHLDFLSTLNIPTVVSTNPTLFEFFRCFIENYNLLSSSLVQLVCNDRHTDGSVEAFYEITRRFSHGDTRKHLMVLADIYFERNPFEHQRWDSQVWRDDCNYLWVYDPLSEQQLDENTGVVAVSGNSTTAHRALHLYFQNKDCLNVPLSQRKLWSGMALFSASCRPKIDQFIQKFNGATEEDLINELIDSGEEFKILFCPLFINVNRYQNLVEIMNDAILLEQQPCSAF